MLANGYAAGAWNGVGGIHSSIAGATAGAALGFGESADLFSSFPASFAGQQVDNTAVLVRYTLAGDANLDRAANIADFSLLAANFNAAGTWNRGDFTYDGQVTIADFSLLGSAFNNVLPASTGGDAALASAPSAPAPRPAPVFAAATKIGFDADEDDQLII
jgi:hypothetical protein